MEKGVFKIKLSEEDKRIKKNEQSRKYRETKKQKMKSSLVTSIKSANPRNTMGKKQGKTILEEEQNDSLDLSSSIASLSPIAS